VNARTAKNLLSPSFQNYVMADADPNSTIVFVTAAPAIADRIISDLKQIDRVKAQVLLTSKVVILEKGDMLNLGVEWGWPQVQAGVFSNDLKGRGGTLNDYGGESPWGIQIGFSPDATFTNALTMALNLLEVNNQATIISQPQLVARDGKLAKLEVITEEYHILYAPDIATSYYSRQELEEIMSGTVLAITPFIGDNNDITMDVAVEVSDSESRSAESDFPIITRRRYSSSLHLKDGGTVAVGGLTENRKRESLREVPGLSKLPLVGPIFTSKSNNGSTKEVAVFVTAEIIPDPSQMPTGLQGSSTNMYGGSQMGRTPTYQAPMGRQQTPTNSMYFNQSPTYQYQAPSSFETPSNQFPTNNYEAPINNRAPMPSMMAPEQQFQDELRGALMR
jgi:general secretion pathway protein D